MKILIVEDEPVLREGLVDLLTAHDYNVEAVSDGEAALRRGSDPAIGLLLLDLMLPGIDGVEVCGRLRKLRRDLPILMLTALGSEDDKVRGLRAGADDYVTKPFGTQELLARVEALVRRVHRETTVAPSIHVDGCEIDLGRCEAIREDRRIPLTAREGALLTWLFHHRERAVGRAELLEVVWKSPGDLQTRTVDMTIANLRQKIETDPTHPQIIKTVKGVGYAWGES